MDSTSLHPAAQPAGEPRNWLPERVESGVDSGHGTAASTAQVLARGLGWFSVGLGLAQLLAPRRFTQLIGASPTDRALAVTRLMGVREITQGLGILRSSNPKPWLWSRVIGDAVDLGLLARAGAQQGANPVRLATAATAVLGTTAADLFDSVQLRDTREAIPTRMPMRVVGATTIRRSAEELYGYWSSFENLPDVMTHLHEVEVLGDGRSRWTTRAPFGTSVSWEAEVTEDVPGEVLAWQSVPSSGIENSGEVRFVPAPGQRGTELHVVLRYEAPMGPVGASLLKLLGDDPVQQVKDDLRRFKQVMETGQVVRSDGAPSGTDAHLQPKQRPAQPQAASSGATSTEPRRERSTR
ncbi:MAG: cyclase [Thermoleophilia bacterium]|nr:cyclase [Thermoleophilia bacterium]